MLIRTTRTHQMSFVEEEWRLGDAIVVRIPATPAARPALLIHLTLHAEPGWNRTRSRSCPAPFWRRGTASRVSISRIMAGMVDGYGEGLTGMAAAFAAGCDVFGPLS